MPQFSIPLPPRFSLRHAVCSYGYFILAPNQWIPAPRHADSHLLRILHTTSGRAVTLTLRQRGRRLLIHSGRKLTIADRNLLRAQVRRMLRLDEDLATWRALHPQAAAARFDRLFRSPTLFEDIVKTMTSCNVTWPSTVRMNRLLCDHIGRGAFPSPQQLAATSVADLARLAKVGYRADRIIRLARDVAAGRLDLAWFEHPDRTTDELYDALITIHGIGPFAANNLLQCLGRYDRLPVDTETLRHFRHLHNVRGDLARITAAARRHYRRYAPYQFLAYWFELWQDYERRFGPAHRWPANIHTSFTATKLK